MPITGDFLDNSPVSLLFMLCLASLKNLAPGVTQTQFRVISPYNFYKNILIKADPNIYDTSSTPSLSRLVPGSKT